MSALLLFLILPVSSHLVPTEHGNSIMLTGKDHYVLETPDADLPVPALISKNGFPVEIHRVTTKDGYILELHRIPHGRQRSSSCGTGRKAGVAFLQHGFLGSSADWIMNTPEKALAYQLADQGYDVFLGNARGNTYSRKHVSLSPKDPRFWAFSYHEMGLHDLPAVIDYILGVTGEEKLFYVGHSMGTAMFWVAMSQLPEYNAKIRLMSALAPVANLTHCRSPVRLLAPLAKELEVVVHFLGDREFLPQRGLVTFFRKIVCSNEPVGEPICENIVFLIAGFDRAQLNETMLPVILGHTPAGASTHTLIHFAQGINSHQFRPFDYGKVRNLEVYGTVEPPPYDLSKVTAPVALYWSDQDWLAEKRDVFDLMPELGNMVLDYRVPYEQFTHLDFIFGIDSDKLLYRKVMETMSQH